MSAAAILSVAARKAASEGKKVGAAALTLIALVVMSLTVFPGLNRATTDQIAEAPASSGSSSESGQSSASSESNSSQSGAATESATTDPTETVVTPETENSTEASQAAAKTNPGELISSKAQKEQVAAILESPAASGIFNSDSRSKVFALDQDYTAHGKNGITAKFTLNPSSPSVFSNVFVEIEIDGYFFEFEPVNRSLFTGQNSEGRDVYMLVGDAVYLYDEFGKKWSDSEIGRAIVKIEVVMETNGTTLESVNLALYNR
jgi:hypothetical protein